MNELAHEKLIKSVCLSGRAPRSLEIAAYRMEYKTHYPECSAAARLPRWTNKIPQASSRAFYSLAAILVEERKRILRAPHQNGRPAFGPPSDITREKWRIELPKWCKNQLSQITGPADDAELIVNMLNCGATGVILDLEDTVVDRWGRQRLAHEDILQALYGTLSYYDQKRRKAVSITPNSTLIGIQPRGPAWNV